MAVGICERIGQEVSYLKHTPAGSEKVVIETSMKNHEVAIQMVLDALTDVKHGVIKSLDEIGAVGHRVVHGGEKFAASTIITDEVINAIEECNELAPLHNPANLIGIRACANLMKGVPMVAVFDTAFHQSMPEKAFLYAIPYRYYTDYKIRRYGFHGTSHRYVAARAAEILGRPFDELKIITCHLGNGSSIAAVKYGKSIDTSMGFTPLDGLPMGTRSGSIDPAVIEYISENEIEEAQQEEVLKKEETDEPEPDKNSEFAWNV
jgi:acetate kinase